MTGVAGAPRPLPLTDPRGCALLRLLPPPHHGCLVHTALPAWVLTCCRTWFWFVPPDLQLDAGCDPGTSAKSPGQETATLTRFYAPQIPGPPCSLLQGQEDPMPLTRPRPPSLCIQGPSTACPVGNSGHWCWVSPHLDTGSCTFISSRCPYRPCPA